MIDYDSFLHCHLTDIFFRYFRGSERVKFCVLVINQSILLTLSCWILFHYLLLHSHAKFQMEKNNF